MFILFGLSRSINITFFFVRVQCVQFRIVGYQGDRLFVFTTDRDKDRERVKKTLYKYHIITRKSFFDFFFFFFCAFYDTTLNLVEILAEEKSFGRLYGFDCIVNGAVLDVEFIGVVYLLLYACHGIHFTWHTKK